MSEFFRLIFDKCTELFITLWLKNIKRTIRFQLSHIEEAVQEAMAQAPLTDVYFGVCPQSQDLGQSRRGSVQDIAAITAFWMDIDVAGEGHVSTDYPASCIEALEFLKGLPLQPSIIVGSGGGVHSYWLLDQLWQFEGQLDRDKAQEMSRAFQAFIIEEGRKRGWKLDNTSDLTRLLRVPGTLNHKTNPPRSVEIIHMEDRRYSREDFNLMLLRPVQEKALEVTKTVSKDIEYPPADADQIALHCAWMRHCGEDAPVLTEPSWYRMLSILARCIDGDKKAHEWSAHYPAYSHKETEQKMAQALTNAGPATCQHIFEVLDGKGYCDHCPFFGFITSPVQLGQKDQLMQAKFAVASAVNAYSMNPGDIFAEENLKALALIKKCDAAVYNRFRQGFIKAGIPVRKLEQMMASVDGVKYDFHRYDERDGHLMHLKPTQYGEKIIPLCNFSARITEEKTLDDGAESRIVYQISAKSAGGAELPEVSVSATDFPSMNWVSANYGTRAIVGAGQSTKEHLRVAIQALSTEVKRTSAFAHTGWRIVNDRWLYLTSSGAMSSEGLDMSVTVDLSPSLSAYALKVPLYPMKDAFEATLHFLALAPLKVTLPLLCAIFRAPLAELLPIDFTVFIAGRSGSFKSELASLMQAHWGSAFSRTNLPGNWTSTANMLEKMAFWLKDVVFVVDDFLPAHSHLATTELHQKAERLIRGQGNQSGRGRMNADGSLRPTYSPRGLMVMTGEDVPRGLSLNARMLLLELQHKNVDTVILTQMQGFASSGHLAATMCYFVQWLAPQVDDLRAYLRERKDELRNEAGKVVQSHARTPDLVASLMVGLEIFLSCAIEKAVISEEEAMKLRDQAWDVLLAADETQQEMQTESDPVERFISLLKGVFMSGAAHLQSIGGGAPSMANLWGWREDENQGPQKAASPLGKTIGWTDGSNVFLLPDPMWEAVQTLANRQNNPLTTTAITLRKRLAERKMIVVKDGKNLIYKSIQRVKHRVMQMPVAALYEINAPQPVPQPVPTGFPESFFSSPDHVPQGEAVDVSIAFQESALAPPEGTSFPAAPDDFSDCPNCDHLFADRDGADPHKD